MSFGGVKYLLVNFSSAYLADNASTTESTAVNKLVVPRHRRTQFGRRAFSVAGRWPGTYCLTASEIRLCQPALSDVI